MLFALVVFLIFAALAAPGIVAAVRYFRAPDAAKPARLRQVKIGGTLSGVLLILWDLFMVLNGRWLDYLWYSQLDAGQVFMKPLLLKISLFFIGGLLSWLVFWLMTAWQLRSLPALPEQQESEGRYGYRIRNAAAEWAGYTVTVKLARTVMSAVLAFAAGIGTAVMWQKWLMSRNGGSMGVLDPVFHKDNGFYMFKLPFTLGALDWLGGVVLLSWLAAAGLCVWGWYRTSQFSDDYAAALISRFVRRMALLAILPVSMWAIKLWYGRYEMLFHQGKRFSGMGYTALDAHLPAITIHLVLLVVVCVLLLLYGLKVFKPGYKRAGIGAGMFIVLLLGLRLVYPAIIQAVKVGPREKDVERPYIERHIAATRAAFGLDKVQLFESQAKELTLEDLQNSMETLQNIPLWDWRALAMTLDKTQCIRPYYQFPDVDVDRYVINGQYRQVALASRELNLELLPEASRTWINEHLVYTHGYGVTLNQANEFGPQGMPRLLVRDIPPISDVAEIQITRPEIYFGELTRQYVIVDTEEKEFDHPGDSDNVYGRYEGQAGVEIGSGLRRFAFAQVLGGTNAWKVLTSNYISADSRVLWARCVHDRVERLAPFLTFDEDEYKVITDDGRLVYLIDGYTTSKWYPYARKVDGKSYIRNAVKAVVDAYEGTVEFYIFDDQDPVIKMWARTFPGLFHPASEMPEDIRRHVRYPEDLLNLQGEVYKIYHMTDPGDFYGREDAWEIANELYWDEAQRVQAYEMILQVPGQSQEEFVLMLPFTPRGRTVAAGWMAGRSDGEHYGQIRVYKYPHTVTIDGPEMIETRVDQHEDWSKEFSLWKQKGSDVIRGHMLMIPLAGGILYAEPIYLYSTNAKASMPELTRVVVATGQHIAWGRSLDEALQGLFGVSVSSDLRAVLADALRNLDEYLRLSGEGQLSAAGLQLEQQRASLTAALEASADETEKGEMK